MLLRVWFLLISFSLIDNVTAGSDKTGLPDMLDRIKPGIVAVGTYSPTRNVRAVFLGTGFAVADGRYVVTNAHVTSKDLDTTHHERFAVFFRQDRQEHMQSVDLIATDEEHDLALLKLESGSLPSLKIGDSGRVREGELYALVRW